MSAFANISVFDGAGTPVLHTLSAIKINTVQGSNKNSKVIALWRELTPTVPTEAQITAQVELEVLPSGTTIERTITQVPVMESISGQNAAGYTAAPKVAYIDKRVTEQFSAPRSTVNSRRLLRQLDINLQGNITTTVVPNTSGPYVELFDYQITPA